MDLTPEQYKILFGEPPPEVGPQQDERPRESVAPARRPSVDRNDQSERFSIRDQGFGKPDTIGYIDDVPTLEAVPVERRRKREHVDAEPAPTHVSRSNRAPIVIAALLFSALILSPLLLLLREELPEPEVLAEAVVAVEPSNPETTTTVSPSPSQSAAQFPMADIEAARESLARAQVVASVAAAEPFDRAAYIDDDWPDSDGDCQSDEIEVLIEESLVDVALDVDGCRVLGGLWIDPFDDAEYTDPSQVAVDHLVPLQAAHDAGAWEWDNSMKRAFATDINFAPSLITLGARSIEARGNQTPDLWRPPDEAAWCGYAMDWLSVKERWMLTFAEAEVAALDSMLNTCTVR